MRIKVKSVFFSPGMLMFMLNVVDRNVCLFVMVIGMILIIIVLKKVLWIKFNLLMMIISRRVIDIIRLKVLLVIYLVEWLNNVFVSLVVVVDRKNEVVLVWVRLMFMVCVEILLLCMVVKLCLVGVCRRL